jgi:hypothetical protein
LKAVGISEEEQENYQKMRTRKDQKRSVRNERKEKTLESFMED